MQPHTQSHSHTTHCMPHSQTKPPQYDKFTCIIGWHFCGCKISWHLIHNWLCIEWHTDMSNWIWYLNCSEQPLTKIYSCSMHAAYVLLLVLHTCRLHIILCAAYEYINAACKQEGNKLVLHAPRFSAYGQHTSACLWMCVTWMQHARIWPKDMSSMCAALL